MGRPPMPVGHWGNIKITAEHRDSVTGRWVEGERPTRTAPARFTASARVRGQDGNVVKMERTGATSSAAHEVLVDAMRAYARPSGSGTLTGATRLSDLATAWLTELDAGTQQGSTKDTYRRNLNAYIAPRLGGLRVREVTTPTIDRWLREVTTTSGHGSAKTSRTILRGMFALTVQHGAITANPVREASAIKRTASLKEPRALTVEEEERLRSYLAASPYYVSTGLTDLLTFMLATGCRIGEALVMTWPKIDLTPGAEVVAITATGEWLTKANGGGRIKERTKSGDNRVVPLNGTVAAMLRERQETQPKNPLGLVFASAHGTLLDRSNVSSRLRRACDTCDLPDVTSHVMRKTRATRLMDAGVTPREVADLLGHREVSLTLNRYTGRRMPSRASANVE